MRTYIGDSNWMRKRTHHLSMKCTEHIFEETPDNKNVDRKKGEVEITNPIPIPKTKRPITIMGKLGASAVIRAPTKYRRDERINSLLLPSVRMFTFQILFGK